MARTRKSIQPLNLHKYDVLIEDRGARSDYFKISQFDGYFYGGRNAFLVAGAGVLRPNSKILVEVLNKDGNVVYSAPVTDFIEGNSRLIQVEVYSDTAIGPGKLVLLGCATSYLDGTPIPDEWKDKFNVRWIVDISISPLVQNKTPIRFLKQPSVTVQEKFYTAPSSSTFTEKVLVPIDVQLSPKYYNVSQIGYQVKVVGPSNTKLSSDYTDGVITGSLIINKNSTTEVASINIPLTKIYNTTIADSQTALIYTNTNTLISEMFLSSSGMYTYNVAPFGEINITSSINLQYSKLETFNTGSAVSYAKLRIVDAKTLSGEINKIRISYKVTTEPGEYVALSDVNVAVQELLAVDSSSRIAETGKFNEVLVNDYWYFATMSLQRNEVSPVLPSYYISSSLIGNSISQTNCCDDLLDAINKTPQIVNNTFVNNTSYFIGTRNENSIQLFPRSEYTLAFDAMVSKNSASISLNQSDYSLEAYLVEQEDFTAKLLEKNSRGQLLGTLTPEGNFLKQNFEGTEFNFTPKIINSGKFGIRFIVYGGNWSIANVSIKPSVEPFFSPDEIDVLVPNVNYVDKILSYKIQYLDVNNNSAGIETISIPTYFTGSQTVNDSFFTLVSSASFAETASYITHQNPGDNRVITSLGSGSLTGERNLQFDGSTLSVTGSLNVSGSSTLRNIGPAQFTGSVAVTGGITGSLLGTSSFAISSSYVLPTGLPSGIISSSVQLPSGIISSSAQTVTSLTNQNITLGVVSASQLTVQGNLTVLGSSSVQYVTSSQLNIGTNLITVNVQNPSPRFGGLAVIDSGSSPLRSGSLLFDSLNDQWIFVHQNQTSPTSSVLLMGPQTYNNIGNETNLTNNYLLKSVNAEHVGDSIVYDNGTNVGIGTSSPVYKLDVNGSSGFRGDMYVFNNSTYWYNGTSYFQAVNSSNVGILQMTNTTYPLSLQPNGGNVGIGTTSPSSYAGGGLTLGSTSSGKNLIVISSADGNNGVVQFVDQNSNNAFQIGAQTGQVYMYGYGLRPMIFYTSGSERVRIDSSGNVGIGTTSLKTRLNVNSGWLNTVAPSPAGTANSASVYFTNADPQYGILMGVLGTGTAWVQAQRTDGTATTYPLLLNPNAGNVGIGTTSPAVPLHVDATAGGIVRVARSSAGAGTFQMEADGTDGTLAATNTMRLRAGGSERVTVLSTGNVGIGITNPDYKLRIDSANNGLKIVTTAASSGQPSIDLLDGAVDVIFAAAGGSSTGLIGTYSSHPFSIYTSNTSRLTILANGNVGIGTTSPSAKLEVIGNALIGQKSNSSTAARLDITAGGNGYDAVIDFGYYDTFDAGIWNIGRKGSTGAFFISNYSAGPETNVITINTSNNVGIGTTNPLTLLDVNGSSTFRGTMQQGSIYRYSTLNSISVALNSTGWIKLATVATNAITKFLMRNGSANSEEVIEFDVYVTYVQGQNYVNITRQTYNQHVLEILLTGTPGGNPTVYVRCRTSEFAPTFIWQVASAWYQPVPTIHNIEETPSSSARSFLLSGVGYFNSAPVASFTGSLGIGTTSPSSKLHVNGDISIATDSAIRKNGDNSIIAYSSTLPGIAVGSGTVTDLLVLNAGGSEKVRINTSGNVGIGTTTPYSQLHLTETVTMGLAGNARPAFKPTNWGYSTSYRVLLIGSPSTIYNHQNTGSVTIAFNYDPIINANSAFNGDGREIIFRNGTQFVTPNAANTSFNLYNLVLLDDKVGIRTVTPSATLQVAGDIRFGTNGVYTDLRMHTDTALSGYNQTNVITPTTIPGGGTATSALYLKTAGTGPGYTRMDLIVDGNVGIGTTSPLNLLHVQGSNSFVRISNPSTGDGGLKISYQNSDTHGLHLSYNPNNALAYIDNTYPTSSGTPYGNIYFRQNINGTMTSRMMIEAQTGNVGIGTTSPRTKLDVVGITSLESVFEKATISATAATGTINFDINTQAVLYYTSNASGNWTLNIRGNSTTSLNTILATQQTVTCTFLVTNGSPAYYQTAFQIDGTAVTPRWQGGTAPSAGNANGIDVYTFAITKTASATYTVLASMTRFA